MNRTGRIVDANHPKSRLGTPQHTGPYARLRLDLVTKLDQGNAVLTLLLGGKSIRAAARTLGLSRMTAWRRVWFLHDYINGGGEPIPHQRSTRAVPRGAPWLLPRDAEDMLRLLLDSGPHITPEAVFASVLTVPECVRNRALRILVSDLMPREDFEQFERQLRDRARPAPEPLYYPSPSQISQLNRRMP